LAHQTKADTLSPKDAVTEKVNDRMAEALVPELQKVAANSPNEDTVAFVTAARKAFKVTSGKEILSLFALSSRIREDLSRALGSLWLHDKS
jgi:hypothetical protein